jgi:hypothetical protein
MFKYVTVDGDDAEGDTLRVMTAEDIADDIVVGYYDGEPPSFSKLWTMTEDGLVPVEVVKTGDGEPRTQGSRTWRCEFWQTRLVGKDFADGVREDFKVWILVEHEKV